MYYSQVLNSSSTTTSSRVAKTTSSQRLHHITSSSSTSSSQSQLSTTTSGKTSSGVNPHALQRDLNEFKNSMSEINNLASNQMTELQKRQVFLLYALCFN